MPQLAYTQNPQAGMHGMLADNTQHDIVTGIHPNSASVDLEVGVFVCRNSTVAGREDEVKLPASAADVNSGGGRGFSLGTAVHINPDVIGDNNARSSYRPGEALPVVKRGTMYIRCETAYTAGDKVYVRHAVGAVPATNRLGRIRKDVDDPGAGARATELPGARFETTGTSETVAKISFDVRPTA